MTYYKKDWNIYVANFLMKKVVKFDTAERGGEIKSESYFIAVELFRCENPEEAYNRISAIAKSGHEDSYHDGEDLVEIHYVGLNDLDLIQKTDEFIKDIFERNEYGVDITSIRLPNQDFKMFIREKKDLTLFDEYYNYNKKE